MYSLDISMTYDISHIVCSLQTFGCLEWESELYRGIMRARCYPLSMRGHHFHNINPKVHSQSLSQGYIRDILNIKKVY